MQLTLITVGKCKNAGFQQAAQDYIKRLGHYASLKEIQVKEEKAVGNTKEVINKEGLRLLQAIPQNTIVIGLDPTGKHCTSEYLAQTLSDMALRSQSRVAFLIGGAFGLSPEVQKRANWCLSLSKMTFPHEMARVSVLEQLYRAFTIIRGEQYHK
ncbi:MAG: 23S rRNA (pseudouridine(1915)-N(3))-methyltransferase RlmH [Candidatus Latescibacteria bacterium]|nr:23S rRNA (pseudouridine(1915)-N(3))-methyltransferase RlmH [Candidatus Latescibacterota bacterium]